MQFVRRFLLQDSLASTRAQDCTWTRTQVPLIPLPQQKAIKLALCGVGAQSFLGMYSKEQVEVVEGYFLDASSQASSC